MDYDYFIHPTDRSALDAMKSMPGFTVISRKFSDIFVERSAKLMNLSSKLRVSEKQLPHIYEMLPPICEKLEMPVPELYIESNPSINAFTIGAETPAILLNSGLLTNCSTETIKAVIAHECGHIVCGHCMYHAMVGFFTGVGASIINIPLLTFALKYAMLYWKRCSESSADRASAYVFGPDAVVKTMMELSCGERDLIPEIDQTEFLNQAKEYFEYGDESGWNKFLMYFQLVQQTHPFTATRAADIVNWCKSEDYDNLCRGLPYTKKKTGSQPCPKCGHALEEDASFCPGCGAKIVRCSGCGAAFTDEDKFCDNCGTEL